jgi:hypothetical protein
VRADNALVVCAAPEPPKPKPPPRPPDAPSPKPTEGSRPRLRPEDPRLRPTPRSTPAETERPRDAERLTARIGLLDGPMPIPPLTPTPGSIVAVTATQPFRMLPPLSHVAVVGLPDSVGMVTRLPRLEVGIMLLMTPVKLVGMVRAIEVDGNDTPTPAPIVADAATLADKLTPIGLLGTSEVTPGRAEIRDEAPSNTAPGM